jgi:Domain of unknown function (DUF5047)
VSVTVPDWVRDAVADTHSIKWSVYGLYAAGGAPVPLPVTAGDLLQSSDAYPRHTARVTLGDMSLAPVNGSSLLTPFGNRLRIRATVSDLTGRSAVIAPCPDLLIDTVTVARGDDVRLEISGSDLSLGVDTDAFTVPTDPPVGFTTVSALIGWLIRRTYPAAVIVDTLNSVLPVGSQYQMDGSPWAMIEGLADSAGGEVYQRADNAFIVRPVPAVGEIDAGDVLTVGPGGTVTGTSSTLLRGYNRVALAFRSDAADDRTIVGSWADRSTGPLSVNGPYGRVTLAETRDLDASQSRADAAAVAYARRVAGRVRDAEVTATARPWVETGDTITVGFTQGADALVLTEAVHDLTGAPSRYRFRTDTIGPIA